MKLSDKARQFLNRKIPFTGNLATSAKDRKIARLMYSSEIVGYDAENNEIYRRGPTYYIVSTRIDEIKEEAIVHVAHDKPVVLRFEFPYDPGRYYFIDLLGDEIDVLESGNGQANDTFRGGQ